jgi:hypothetical protein
MAEALQVVVVDRLGLFACADARDAGGGSLCVMGPWDAR